MKSQSRIETSQAQLGSTVTQSHALLERSQELNVSAASTLQESQIRIDNQLEQILQAQSRQLNPVLCGSLDASSPEGRETWMELGRLLREEGITPNVISNNKGLLIQAMKKSIQGLSDSPNIGSYSTALEYQSVSTPAQRCLTEFPLADRSMSLLSSAPSLGETFSNDLLARSTQIQTCLEHEDNIEDGMRSLMGGMTDDSKPVETSEQPGVEMDDYTDNLQSLEFTCMFSGCGMKFRSESDWVAHRNVCIPVFLACMVLGADLMQAPHPVSATSEYESSYKTLSPTSLEWSGLHQTEAKREGNEAAPHRYWSIGTKYFSVR